MELGLLAAFQALDRHSTTKDIKDACRQLFLQSDEYCLAGSYPFDAVEIEEVANAIYDYIECPDRHPPREIRFNISRPLEGETIEYCEYASRFSESMLYQNVGANLTSLELHDVRARLKVFLVGILFRYQFCVTEDRTDFPFR